MVSHSPGILITITTEANFYYCYGIADDVLALGYVDDFDVFFESLGIL